MIGTLRTASVVSVITVITVAVFFLELFPGLGSTVFRYGALTPQAVLDGQVWRLITYGFLHDPSDIWHIAFNMLGLWIFGHELEFMLGKNRFLILYLFGILFSGLFSFFNLLYGAGYVPIIGASGSIYALLFLYAAYFPDRQLLLFFFVPISVRTAVIFFALISLFGMLQNAGGIAHAVHLGGFAAGWIFLRRGRGMSDWILSRIDGVTGLFRRGHGATFHSFARHASRQKMNDETDRIDEILRKISRQGISSLTENEWKILKRHSDEQ
ncbi:MAG: rhomboid family intramembrane serine protease [Fibrobacterota bacterium]